MRYSSGNTVASSIASVAAVPAEAVPPEWISAAENVRVLVDCTYEATFAAVPEPELFTVAEDIANACVIVTDPSVAAAAEIPL